MADIITIPVFPLPIVVFPNEELRLHIFEPRYKQLIQDCKETGIIFGILTIYDNRLMEDGCLVKLIEISKLYEDGRMDVRLQSLEKFRKIHFIDHYNNKLYSGAEITTFDESEKGTEELYLKTKILFDELCSINKVQPYRSVKWLDYKSYDIGHFVGFNIHQEYSFFALATEDERLEYLIIQLEFMIEHSRLRANWIKQIHMNGEFREFKSSEWK
ncbi:MAG: LON peptidase substrate-binding domain-containing protein [Saprospiraceae bacterium]|nr:LON peptidase substrate-binding domain-containing protein [Saprospiraceae bacterium]